MREQQTLFSYTDIAETHFPKVRWALKQRYQPHLEYLYLQTRREQQNLCIKKEEKNEKPLQPHSANASLLIHISLNSMDPAVPI